MSKCCANECQNESYVKGLCKKHYTTMQRHGDANYKRTFKKDQKCIAEGCERTQKANGYCHAHYKKMRETGTLDKIIGTEGWRQRLGAAKKTELTILDPTPDPSGKGYLAVNVVNDLKYKARQRGIDWTLTPIQAYKLIIGDCLYHGGASGWPLTRNGIDRVDNTKGYHIDNCVSCCTYCNSAKMGRSLEEFIDWIKQVHNTLVKGG